MSRAMKSVKLPKSKGKVETQIKGEMKITAPVARQHVNRHLVLYVGNLLRAGEPDLQVRNGGLEWDVPIIYSLPDQGDLGVVGHYFVDAQNGDLNPRESTAMEELNAHVSRLYQKVRSQTEFEEIDNPYAAYAEGGVVGDPEMFYGREKFVQDVAQAIRKARTQSRCIIIYGQKRIGKSSILYHLKAELANEIDLLILDLGNIGSILDEHSQSPMLHQLLWGILSKLRSAIEDKIEQGYDRLILPFPSAKEFYGHPSPLLFFKEFLELYRRRALKSENWRHMRAVLLVDEFSYIHSLIVSGHVADSFMKHWKALMQEDFFSAVLVGQDAMSRFRQRFPNEFGTSQDKRVSYLDHDDARRLIDEPIRINGRQGESRYRERAIERIVDLTAGSPFYIQIICNRLVEYLNRKRARLITEADVEQVKNEMIRGANALTPARFDNLVNSGDTSDDAISDEDTLKVLTAIAAGSEADPCNSNNITCETHTPVNSILDDLEKREVTERIRGHYYTIRVGLFKEWLIAHQ